MQVSVFSAYICLFFYDLHIKWEFQRAEFSVNSVRNFDVSQNSFNV